MSLRAYASVSVEAHITRVATEMGVDPTLAKAVAWCESGYKQGVKNAQGSSASGVFQIIKSTWQGSLKAMGLPPNLDVFDAGSNILVGVWLMKEAGTRPWDASKHCWSKLL